MNKRILILTTYIIFMISMITAGYYYQTKDACWKQSTKGYLGIDHRVKCKGE